MLVLRLGFIPLAESEELRADVEGFADALAEAIGDPVKPLFAPDYKSLLTALEMNIAQIAWVPPVIAARAVQKGAIVPAALAVRGGVSMYSTALFARAGSPIGKPADLDRARVAWVDKDSAGGYLVVRDALRAAGVDFEAAFGEEEFLGHHTAVARAVLDRKVDVGATYFTYQAGTKSIARAGWREVGGDDKFKVVFEAGPIPADFFGVHKSIAGARVDALQGALVDGRSEKASQLGAKLFQSDGFVRPTQEHHAALRGLLSKVEAGSNGAAAR